MTQCKDIILRQFVQNADVSCEIPIKHDTEKFYLMSWLDSSIGNVINNCLELSLTKRLEKYSIRPRMLSAGMFTHSDSWWRLVGVHDDYVRRRRTTYSELHFERRRCVLTDKSDGRQPIRQTDDVCRIISSKMAVCFKHLEVVRHNISQYGLNSKCWRLCVNYLESWGTISASTA